MMLKNAKNAKDIPSSACFVGGGEIKISDAPRGGGVRPNPVGSMLSVAVLPSEKPATTSTVATSSINPPGRRVCSLPAVDELRLACEWENDESLRKSFGNNKAGYLAYRRALKR